MRKLICVVPAVLLCFSSVDATTPVPKIDTSPKTEEVRNLQSLFVEIRMSDDPVAVEALEHNAIDLACECFSSDNPIVRAEALTFVHENIITINLSSIDECTSGPIGDDVYAKVFRSALDSSQLFFLDESDKRDILRECMRTGKCTLWRGTGLGVTRCVGEAAWGGVPGLGSDIEKAFHKKTSNINRANVSLEKMLAIYAIMERPGTGWDQYDEVVRKILAMGDAGVARSLENDEYFRSVVLNLLHLYCSFGKKSTCEALESAISSAVDTAFPEGKTPSNQVYWWWQCALLEYGTFTPRPIPQTMDEMVEAAIHRPFCDSWNPNRYPREEEQTPAN